MLFPRRDTQVTNVGLFIQTKLAFLFIINFTSIRLVFADRYQSANRKDFSFTPTPEIQY